RRCHDVHCATAAIDDRCAEDADADRIVLRMQPRHIGCLEGCRAVTRYLIEIYAPQSSSDPRGGIVCIECIDSVVHCRDVEHVVSPLACNSDPRHVQRLCDYFPVDGIAEQAAKGITADARRSEC